jgi:SAM-dependent methyltransferase
MTDAVRDFGNQSANLEFLDATGLLGPDLRVLEIGSGRGALLQALRGRGLNVVGVEISADRIAESVARFGPLPIRQIHGATLPFPDAAFDLVVSFDVFEHIPDSDAHLAEVHRVLKPGGWYLLQTPNKWSNTVFETIRWRSYTRWRADHCSLHSYAELERRFRRGGFETSFSDVKVVTPYFRDKVHQHLGVLGTALLALFNPDRLPLRFRTNLYLRARKR